MSPVLSVASTVILSIVIIGIPIKCDFVPGKVLELSLMFASKTGANPDAPH
jgi:hypothetical protein